MRGPLAPCPAQSRPLSLLVAFATLLGGATACFDDPRYEALRCPDGFCPSGYVCGADVLCHKSGDLSVSDPARCALPVGYPDSGWEARDFALTATNGLGRCLGVATVSADEINEPASPGGPIPGTAGHFGTRYTSERAVSAPGVQTFTVTYADGLRVLVDGQKVYEDWLPGPQKSGVEVRTPYLTAGVHRFVIERFAATMTSEFHATSARGCGTFTATGTAWLFAYYMVRSGAIDLQTCYGVETVPVPSELALAWSSTIARPAPLAAANVTSGFAVEGHARRLMYGNTTFKFSHDAGLRFLIDGAPLYDQLGTPSPAPMSAGAYSTGSHGFQFLLVDDAGKAALNIAWSTVCSVPLDFDANTWAVRYYRLLTSMSTNPPSYGLDYGDCLYAELLPVSQLDFDWGTGAPAALSAAIKVTTNWGAEYVGQRTIPGTGNATVRVTHADGLRVYIDGVLLYSQWLTTDEMGSFTVEGGTAHTMLVRYFDDGGNARLHVNW